ncbi:MAG: pyridoxal phosphate-dependent aminotransferase [Oscillospiraceae bacterium]|nr:pyridoxal phosphate-dependent aminotransferase [Oscillospiraceae bacterium]
MASQFDRPVPARVGMEAAKWDMLGDRRKDGVVPLSVADMEFRSPEAIITALEETARFGMWGYTGWGDRYYNAIRSWMKQRHNWEVQREWIIRVNGVVQGLGAAIRAFTRPGDYVVIQPPVYPHFFDCVTGNDRLLAENPLIRTKSGYEIDFEDLERQLSRPEVTAMILCSPHNPVGRVWTEKELRRLGDLCLKHRVLVLSDEIHSDLVQPGHPHTVFASLGEEHAKNCVIGSACSKTFSLAGLCCANMIVPDPEKKARLAAEVERSGCTTFSTFGTVALEVGYEQCAPWVDELMEYVYGNYEYLRDFLAKHFPELWLSPLEGTYLAWIDFAPLEPDGEKRAAFLEEQAGLFLTHGAAFGAPTFERVNLACTRTVLAQALDRLLLAAGRSR